VRYQSVPFFDAQAHQQPRCCKPPRCG
jgi:hypothetical protein